MHFKLMLKDVFKDDSDPLEATFHASALVWIK